MNMTDECLFYLGWLFEHPFVFSLLPEGLEIREKQSLLYTLYQEWLNNDD